MKASRPANDRLALEMERLKKRLAEMQEWEAKYKSLVKASPFAVTVTDLKGNITDLSRRTLSLHGYKSADELLGKNVFTLIAPKHRNLAAENMEKVLEKGCLGPVAYEFLRKDGTPFLGELDASLIKDTRGKPTGFIATIRDITQRKEIESAMKTSEERYKAIFERSLFAVFIHDLEGLFIDANQTAVDMLGYKKKGVPYLHFADLLDEEQIPLAKKTVAEIIKTGHQKKPTRYRLKNKGGGYIWVETESSLIYKDGKPYAVLGIARDISDQKKAGEALRESEEKYRRIYESLHDVYYRTDRDGIVTEISPSVYTQAGWDPEDVIGHPVTDFYRDPSSREIFTKSLKETGTVNDYELRLLAKDGRVIEVSVSAHILFDKNGDPIGVEGVLRDITKRKGMEEALRESEEKFRTMVEHSLQGIFIIQNFKIVYANDALARITGFTLAELLSLSPQKIQDIVHPEDQELVWGRMADRLAGKDVPSRYEFKAVRKNGEPLFLEMVVGLIEFQGKPAIQGAVIDITDRKLADDQIQASLEEKEVMLREIHHRVKNNMQIILSLLRIQSRAVHDENTREMFQQSQSRIRSMALVHEGLYKSEDLAKIDIADYISRVTTHLLSVYRAKLGDIKIKQEAEGVYLNINRAIPCGLIISELVSNCLKHAFPEKKEGQITIKMKKGKHGSYSLAIKDDGIGFPEGLDFRQTETIGMQLVTDLVQQIGGSIEVNRANGTEFIVKFKGIDTKV